jgi:hypothetical protein
LDDVQRDFFSVHEPTFQPAVIAAVIAFTGVLFTVVIGTIYNVRTARKRMEFEERLADQKQAFDERLSQQRFDQERNLAQEKVEHERAMEDWRRRSIFAEDALARFYEARSRIRAIRSPASYASENDDRDGRDQEPDNVRTARDTYYPIARRLNEAAPYFNDMYVGRYRAHALFGMDGAEPYSLLWGQLSALNVAVGSLVGRAGDEHPDRQRRLEETIWEGLGEPDKIAAAVEKAVYLAEQLFGPIIVNRPV